MSTASAIVTAPRRSRRRSGSGALGWLAHRLAITLLTLFVASVLVFLGVRALPGDPAMVLAGQSAGSVSAEQLEEIREEYGLNDSLVSQYLHYVVRAAQGDLGRSTDTGLPVVDTIADRLPVTAELAVLSLALALLIGTGAGILAAKWQGRFGDYAMSTVGLVGVSVPTFWLGLVLSLVFAVHLGWLPASGFTSFADDPIQNLRQMVLPVIALGTGAAASYMRQMRSSMVASLQADYVRTARAKGLRSYRVIMSHAARNSLITIVTLTGLQLGALISGAVVVEQVFVIPGLGKLILDGVFARDYAMVQGVTLVTVLAYVVITLLVDLVYVMVDPRIRVGGRA